MNDTGVPDFNALQNAFDKTGTESIVYFLFDVLHLNGKDLRGLPFKDRRAALEALFAEFDSDRVRLSQTFATDGVSVLQSACNMGLEGVIAKNLTATYVSRRTQAWLKIKCQRRQEFVVGGYTLRSGSTQEIGSLLLGVYDDEEGNLISAGSFGTGWSFSLAAALLKRLQKLEVEQCPFDPRRRPTKGRWSKRAAGSERWVKPTIVAEVSFAEWTPEGSIRHATFQGLREDKPARSIRREAALP